MLSFKYNKKNIIAARDALWNPQSKPRYDKQIKSDRSDTDTSDAKQNTCGRNH